MLGLQNKDLPREVVSMHPHSHLPGEHKNILPCQSFRYSS